MLFSNNKDVMNKIYLKQSLALNPEMNGEIDGLAYSGAVIKNHGFYENLIIDLSTLSIAKEKTPILKDHNPTQVAGFGKAEISDKNVRIKGRISKKNSFGAEILDLASDGFDWEMSLGVYDGQLVEFVNGEFNGLKVEKGVVLKNGVIREISVVALGADQNTQAEIFKTKGDSMINMNQEQWEKFACGCGGNKDSKPEDLQQKFADGQEQVDKLKAEIETLKSEIAAKQAELDKMQGEKDEKKNEDELNAALKEKGIELAVDKVKEAAKSKEATQTLLSFIKEMKKPETQIPDKFSKVIDAGKETLKVKEDELAEKASELVKSGKAKNFDAALSMLEVI